MFIHLDCKLLCLFKVSVDLRKTAMPLICVSLYGDPDENTETEVNEEEDVDCSLRRGRGPLDSLEALTASDRNY